MSNEIPKTVFLQQFEDPEIDGFQNEEVTWCVAEYDRVNDFDIEYINIEEYQKLEKELAEVKDLCKEASDYLDINKHTNIGLEELYILHTKLKEASE